MVNKLANSSSAYLKSAAHQPIDWHEFGEEAFQLAKDLDRPVLLDIGAVWCHWCHVIDRESYDNPEIAQLINEHYVAIKVDRDQRPDVDARYQQVVQALSGQGGWPLTAFLTYDGRLVYGGTYFPPATMKSLLGRIHQVYQERKKEIFAEGEAISDESIRKMEAAERAERGIDGPVETISSENLKRLCTDFTELVLSTIKRGYDPVHGGFGSQPKFPHFSTLELMIAYAWCMPNAHELIAMIEKTLTEMARGGIYDQVAGGFHRYSVDDHWHVPHFEKMAYDNAEALKVYAQTYRLTGIPFYKEVAEGIIGWVSESLSDQKHGGFYASQDADIDLEDDGDHFTWSPTELAEILTPEESEVTRRYYDVHEKGDMHHAVGRNVLFVSRPTLDIARELSLPVEQVESLLASAQQKMRDKRRVRPIPFIDQTLYTNWNGMMLAAWFEAADLLDLPDARDFAKKSLQRILHEFYRKGDQVFHTTHINGFLEDYAWLALATLKGYQSTGNAHYLDVCRDIADMLVAKFEDTQLGGFYDTPKSEQAIGLLKVRRKPVEDNPSSSANAVALQVLNALYYLTPDPAQEARYRRSVERGLNLLIHQHGHYGMYVSALGLAALFYQRPPLKLEVLGASHDLQMAARQTFFPGKILSWNPSEPANEIRVCAGMQCLTPVTTPEALQEQLKSLCALTHPIPTH